jgi:hypothetical protein
VITPLDLIKIAGLIPSNPGLVINNPYRMLWINKIGLQLQLFRINNLSWNSSSSSKKNNGVVLVCFSADRCILLPL